MITLVKVLCLQFLMTLAQDNITIVDQIDYKYSFPLSWSYTEVDQTKEKQNHTEPIMIWAQADCLSTLTGHVDLDDKQFLQQFLSGMLYFNTSYYNAIITKFIDFTNIIPRHSTILIEIGIIVKIQDQVEFDILLSSEFLDNVIWTQNSLNKKINQQGDGDFMLNFNCSVVTYQNKSSKIQPDAPKTLFNLRATTISQLITHSCQNLTLFIQCLVTNKNTLSQPYQGINLWVGYLSMVIIPTQNTTAQYVEEYETITKQLSNYQQDLSVFFKDQSQFSPAILSDLLNFTNSSPKSLIIDRGKDSIFPYSFCPLGCNGCQPLSLPKKNLINVKVVTIAVFQQQCCSCVKDYLQDDYKRCYLPKHSWNNITQNPQNPQQIDQCFSDQSYQQQDIPVEEDKYIYTEKSDGSKSQTIYNKSNTFEYEYTVYCNCSGDSKYIYSLANLIPNDFKAIFDVNQTDQSIIFMSQWLIKKVVYKLKFTNGFCVFNQQLIKMTGQIINFLPNLERMELYLCSLNPNNQATLIFQETLEVKDFSLLQFSNIIISLNDSRQGFVSIEYYPGSFYSTFNLLNVSIQGSANELIGAKTLSFVLYEFLGTINFINVILANFKTKYPQQLLGFADSSLFFDELTSSRLVQNFVFNIRNFTITDCLFEETAEIITFPINNIDLRVDMFVINNTQFFRQSKVFRNSETLQLNQQLSQPIRSIILKNIIISSSAFRDQSEFILVDQNCYTNFAYEITAELRNIQLNNFSQYNRTIFIESSCSEITWIIADMSVLDSNFEAQSIIIKDTQKSSDYDQLIRFRSMNVIFQNAFILQNLNVSQTQFLDDSTLMIIKQKDVYISNLYIHPFYNQSTKTSKKQTQSFSSLMLIDSFMKIIYLNQVVFVGIHQSTTVLEIIDSNSEKKYQTLIQECARKSNEQQQSDTFETCYPIQNKCFQKIGTGCPSIQIINSKFIDITLDSWQVSNCAPLSITSKREILLIDIRNSTFQRNLQNGSVYSIQLSSGLKISAAQADILIKDCVFQQNTALYGQNSLTIINSNRTTIVQSSFFENNFMQNSSDVKGNGGHALISSVQLEIISCSFLKGKADTGGGLYIVILATQKILNVSIQYCSFSENQAIQRSIQGKGGHIYIEFQVLKLLPDDFTDIYIQINNSIFQKGLADFGSGAIHIIPNILANLSLSITNSSFLLCYGKSAHFLDLSYIQLEKPNTVAWNVSIQYTNFSQVSQAEFVQLSEGSQIEQKGSNSFNSFTFILFWITYEPQGHMLINHTNFRQIYWASSLITNYVDFIDLYQISVSQGFTYYVPYIHNQFSQLVKIFDSQFVSLQFLQNDRIINSNTSLQKQNTQPNQQISYMFLFSDAHIFIMNNTLFQDIKCKSCFNGTFNLQNVYKATITNNVFFNNLAEIGGGLFIKYDKIFNGTVMIANNNFENNNAVLEGGAIYIMYLDTLNLNITKNNQKNNAAQVANYLRIISTKVLINQSLNNEYPSNQIEGVSKLIQVGCLSGTAFSNISQKCEFCGEGFYNFKNNSANCIKCDLQRALGCRRNVIDVLPGFWRIDNTSDIFTMCSHAINCIGGTSTNLCAQGLSGALCRSCDTQGILSSQIYTRRSENSCIKCQNNSFITTRFILVFILIMVTIYMAVFSTMQDIVRGINVQYLHLMGIFVGANYNRYLYASVYLKIMTTHFLVLVIAFNMDVGISENLSAAIQSLGYPLQQLMYSYDCYTIISTNIPQIYLRVIAALIFPFIFYAIFVIIIIAQKKGSCIYLKQVQGQMIQKGTFKVAALFSLIYFQPNLVKLSLGLIFCKTIQDVKYISDDTTQVCYSPLHLSYMYVICLPVVLIFLAAMPVLMFVLLYKNQNYVQTISTKLNLGYFTLGYQNDKSINKYWDLIQMQKRMSSVILFTFFSDQYSSGLIMIFVTLVYVSFLRSTKPYKSKYLHYVDSRLSLIQCFIYIVALILQRNQDQVLAKVSMVSLFIFLNVYALIFILYHLSEGLPSEWVQYMKMKKIHIIKNYCCLSKCIKVREFVHRQRMQELWKLVHNMTIKQKHRKLNIALKKQIAFSKMFGRSDADKANLYHSIDQDNINYCVTTPSEIKIKVQRITTLPTEDLNLEKSQSNRITNILLHPGNNNLRYHQMMNDQQLFY